MKISVNWLREFTSIKLPVDELVAKIGAQLGEVEEVIDWGKQYEGVVVAKIISCEPHPNADKLQVCKIDDGGVAKKVKRDDKGLVQVVCGAPNVRKGLTVAWLPPGTIVPSTYDNEQFKLDVRPLRGVDSNGMLASAKELNIGDDHDGILVVDKPAKPGASFAKLYELDDYIIEIENKMFTHRPDCFGILGVAREIAGIQGLQFKSPDWYLQSLPLKASKAQQTMDLKIKNGIPKLVPRFVAVALSDVKVARSPVIMRSYLSRLGVKPISNVVDITNFVMLLTAQPLHAYDADKLPKLSLETRLSRKGDKVALLNGKTLTLQDDKTMLITSGDAPVGVAGIMGGRDTEVDFNTTNIVLECASFDMYAVRRASMAHGLFTDALTRFNKGQSPLQNDVVATYAVGMLQKLAHAELASNVIDTAPDKSMGFWKGIHVGRDFINARLGLNLSIKEIAELLQNVEMSVKTNADNLMVSPPFWRTDLEIPEDIVEEVGRLYGYDHLPLVLPRRDLMPVTQDPLMGVKSRVREVLSRAGANEVLTYSFVHGDLLKSVGQDPAHAFKLSNALSPDLQYYRLSLTPSLLDKVHMNIRAGFDEFALFELNKVHNKADKDPLEKDVPAEHQRLALTYAAKTSSSGAAFYQAKALLQQLTDSLGVDVTYMLHSEKTGADTPNLGAWFSPFAPKRSALITVHLPGQTKPTVLGIVGEYKTSIAKQLKLPPRTAGFELDTVILQLASTDTPYRPLSRFPSTSQDISFKVDDSVSYAELYSVVEKVLTDAETKHGYNSHIEPVDIYAKPKVPGKHITLRITLTHHDRTLVTQEVNKLLDQIATSAHKAVKAIRL